jgi:hypothetical protein
MVPKPPLCYFIQLLKQKTIKKNLHITNGTALLQIKPMKLCAFASEIADELLEIKA